MASEDSNRTSVSIRMSRKTATRLRTFIRDYAGKPHYLKLGPFVEDAVNSAMDRIEEDEETRTPVHLPGLRGSKTSIDLTAPRRAPINHR